MLSKARKAAFRILLRGFCYLPVKPVTWNLEQEQLYYNPSASARYHSFALLLNIIISFGSIYDIVTFLIFRPREDYNIGYAGLHLIAAIFTAVPILFVVIFQRHPDTLNVFNELFRLRKEFEMHKREIKLN